jgi:hypothetical protein
MKDVITLKHKVTGKLHYTFDHWPHQWVDDIECLSTTASMPNNHKTQLVDWIPVEDLELVDDL